MNTNETNNTNLTDEKIVEIANKKEKTFSDWFNVLNLSEVMYNGCDLFLDCEELYAETVDSTDVYLYYDIEGNFYHTNDRKYILTREEMYDSVITYIGSSIVDCLVPAVWIRPSQEWIDKQLQTIKTQTETAEQTE